MIPTTPPAKNFYPRSPCGERHNIPPDSVLIIDISIHALLAESDRYSGLFDSFDVISIHALLAESDGRRKLRKIQKL